MTCLMGGVSSADQMPGGTSTGTVEQSAAATQSLSFSADTKTEVHQVAVKTSHSPRALVPISQIQTGRGLLFPPSNQLHEGMDSLPTMILFPPTKSYQPILTKTRNTNIYDVTPPLVETECYTNNPSMSCTADKCSSQSLIRSGAMNCLTTSM